MSLTLLSLNKQLFSRTLSRYGPMLLQTAASSDTVTPQTAAYRLKSKEWVETNEKKLNRPLSPHIQIYRFPLQVYTSGFHRFTGLILNGKILSYIYAMNIPSWAIFSIKLMIAWPVTYHTVNGIRHLAWDTGRGFEKYETITAVVIGTSILAAIGLALL
ncbi:unnamed protein product [Didymodactylos carnosus]|uniref:Succinate dehydrogenase subunit C n=1 Tax=Didymodactylos carnosus TaxID=1234261 RepID=A0A814HP82_9BILA|nr:unnamed protein product [Didymodactylos carnosus]CAF1168376.1 unnamed protein product [Didymodactylos carnosus]CAF3784279.1 unnamed protein product [Didymodactylos carnosus]CAF3979844.1 unnamed protein product [Didymodactylos carnosus]